MTKTMRTLLSLSLAVIMICCCLNVTGAVSAETAASDRTINVMILYDESYAQIMRYYCGLLTTEALESRLLEAARVMQIPYRKTLGLDLQFKVASYESLFGLSYAAKLGTPCLWLTPAVASSNSNSNSERTRLWIRDGTNICQSDICTHGTMYGCYSSLSLPGHASSAHRYLDVMNKYFSDNRGEEIWPDVLALYVGHDICTQYSDRHDACGGMAYLRGKVLVMNGTYDCQKADEADGPEAGRINIGYNMTSLMNIFNHEFGHSMSINEGDEHTSNQPCCMKGGFDDIFYKENVWCDECLNETINYDHLLDN